MTIADLDGLTTLSLVFGGCCSNAWALEHATTENPHAGTLITFLQFVLVALYGLVTHLSPLDGLGLKLKPRAIPLRAWAAQVVLFFLASFLNGAAFAYAVPMPVHIIFRSGGLVANMLVGWLVGGRSYTWRQVASVILVTLGVACTTFAAAPPSSSLRAHTSPHNHSGTYTMGIALLALALLLSGLLGLVQDRTYAHYGRTHWREALFYLHALALPLFVLVPSFSSTLSMSIVPLTRSGALSVATQLVCVAGVHRLTARMGSLGVALVLVLRKAVSVAVSVVFVRAGMGGGVGGVFWVGAGMVVVGTVGYAGGGKGPGLGEGRKGE